MVRRKIQVDQKMVLICGEVNQDEIRVCLLENQTQLWTGHGQSFRVEAYRPKFLTISSSNHKFKLKFTSESGQVRLGCVRKVPRSAWVVSCNNQHTIRPCTIWPRIDQRPADIMFHLGDQIYADRIYWRWWRYLSTVPCEKWPLYRPDIQMEYYREYFETWTPLSDTMASSSHIMIPDDHEIRSRAEVFEYLIAGASSERANWSKLSQYLTSTEGSKEGSKDSKESKKGSEDLETFLFETALEVCERLYLGIRLTNRDRFDYFRVINGVSVIMTERITKPFIDRTYWEQFERFKPNLTSNILWMGGLPPCPVRSNICETLMYRHESEINDDRYDELFHSFFELLYSPDSSSSPDGSSSKESTCSEKDSPQVIMIGGDLHAGAQGRIYECSPRFPRRYLKFHISSPSSGFPSAYIPRDSLDSTDHHRVVVDRYRPSDPNAVWIDFNPFKSHHEFVAGSWADCWQNALSTGYVFWT